MFRLTAVLHRHASVDAVVVGGGPAGIAVVGNLLQHLPRHHRQLWVDPSFQSGRVNARYREVPSNTKVDLFLQFATKLEPLRRVIEAAAEPNAATVLRGLPQDLGCELGRAADLCLLLTQGLKEHFPEARQHQGKVTKANLDKSTGLWTVAVDNSDTVITPRLVLCTGSSPIEKPLPVLKETARLSNSKIEPIHLDTALKPSLLATTLDANVPATVAVVGASHSAILVLMNLYNLAATSHPHLRIKWFSRHKGLRYAKPMDGWILYDNTGLKGEAAKWARSNLEEEAFASSPVSKVTSKLFTPPGDGEEDVYRAEIPGCTHIVQAIGYQRDPLPALTAAEEAGAESAPLSIEHDGLTGRFLAGITKDSSTRQPYYIPGLFGAGIAFPERVTDPAGNVEHAVGFWKFMKFLNRVVPEWTAEPGSVTPRRE